MPKFVNRLSRVVDSARKRYSILVVSGPESGVRQLNVPAFVIPLVIAFLIFSLVGGGVASLAWTVYRFENSRVAALTHENERLAGQLAEIQFTVDEFEARVKENSEAAEELRTLANLDRIPDEVRLLGVGGPPPLSELADAASPSTHVRDAREALNRLDELNRQVEFRRANFKEMIHSFESTRHELDRIPSISPVNSGHFSSGYGMRKDPFTGRSTMHRGVDFSAWTGTPVVATADGHVNKAGSTGTLGLLVEIDHGNGIITRYGHNSRLLVKVGEFVKRGDVIAEVGSTGRSTSPHCHYEVHIDNAHENPWRYILDGGPSTSGGA